MEQREIHGSASRSGSARDGSTWSRWQSAAAACIAGVAVLGTVAVALPTQGTQLMPAGECPGGRQAVTIGGELHCVAEAHDPRAHASEPEGGITTVNGTPDAAYPACFGDGSDGPRVQVLYVHSDATHNRSGAIRDDLLRWAHQVEWTIQASARRTGGTRYVRWLTERGLDGSCDVALGVETVPAAALADYPALVETMRSRGYDRPDRKYLMFVDDDRICGLASAPVDERATSDNASNVRPGWAWVGSNCWDTGDDGFYSTAAHELFHMLGAVQPNAPNATGKHHCTDEYDLICYADGEDVSTQSRCRDDDPATTGEGDHNNWLADCGGDDYFRVPAMSGSYLASHWNTADSRFLSAAPGQGPGYPRGDRPQVTPDPLGRPLLWPSDEGIYRPVLLDAHGWDACQLPIGVRLPSSSGSDSGLLGGLTGSDGAGSDATADLFVDAIARINRAVGTTVLTPSEDGRLHVIADGSVDRFGVELRVRDVRIHGATIRVNPALTGRQDRTVLAAQSLMLSLGVGHTSRPGDLMAPWPAATASWSDATLALKHLYTSGCDADPRLEDRVPGHPSQRQIGGSRSRVDVANTATDAIGVGVQSSAWLRSRSGDGWASTAVVCRDDVFADCLGGAALAGTKGPLVFVPGGPNGGLPTGVRDELAASLGRGATVWVLGGPAAVSTRVEQQLAAALPSASVRRIAGADRYATGAAVAQQVARQSSASTVLVARGDNPADAVAAGAVAAERGLPVLLVAPRSVPAVTSQALQAMAPDRALILGGPAAIAETAVDTVGRYVPYVERIAGESRSGTAAAIARSRWLWDRHTVTTVGSVVGVPGWGSDAWAVALAAAGVGAHLDAPVLYLGADGIPAVGTKDVLLASPVAPGSRPRVVTAVVGARDRIAPTTVRAFHASALPGLDAGVTVVMD